VTGTDPAAATSADLERSVRRTLLCLAPGADPVAAVMGVVRPVVDAKDDLIRALRLRTPGT
jgi:hypothetical protein